MQILVVDDERNINRMMSVALESAGHQVATAESGFGALRQMQKNAFDIAFLDLRLGQEDGLEVLARIRRSDPKLAVVLITAHGSIPAAVEAMRLGAADFISKPFTPEELRLIVERIAKTRGLQARIAELESMVEAHSPDADLTSDDAGMRSTLDLAFQAADSQASILLLGESGTGKSVLARAIHARSSRREQAFVTVSCPSLSRELLESDLFGHVKGAFTGAIADTEGKVAAANRGTLYLDEISETPHEIQAKLLRLLQEREYERVGETQTRRANVRVISSSNRDLAKAIKEGKFREDLFYRLNVIALELPPLRERPRDLARLAQAHLDFFNRQTGKSLRGFSQQALRALHDHPWPGNLRELRNVVERAVIYSAGDYVEASALKIMKPAVEGERSLELGANVTLADLSDEHIRRVLAKAARLEDAAAILGIDLATLYRRRRKWQNGGTEAGGEG
jgi:NtrC-family two-component system response regulator AlgB